MFESQVKIDKKRRVTIPAKYRADIGNVVIVKLGLDNCLEVHPLPLWEKGETKSHQIANELSLSHEDRMLRRFLFRGERVEVDAAGRILIPERYAAYAKLKEDVILLANAEGFEIWSAENWDEAGLSDMQKIREIVERRSTKGGN